jgi:hypothetical protein
MSTVCDLLPYEISQSFSVITGSSYTIQPASWIAPHVPLIAVAFDRYRMQSLEFVYEPQATSTTVDRLVLAWTDDPSHPFLSAEGAAVATTPPTQLQQLVTSDSMAFMPWKQFSLRVPVSKDERFLFNPEAAIDADSTSLNRFYAMGSLSCTNSNVTLTGAVQYGILYARMVLDFYDPVPIVADIKSLIATVHDLRAKRRKRVARLVTVTPPSTPVQSTPDGEDLKAERKDRYLYEEPEFVPTPRPRLTVTSVPAAGHPVPSASTSSVPLSLRRP